MALTALGRRRFNISIQPESPTERLAPRGVVANTTILDDRRG